MQTYWKSQSDYSLKDFKNYPKIHIEQQKTQGSQNNYEQKVKPTEELPWHILRYNTVP